jgi:hypothetical protein
MISTSVAARAQPMEQAAIVAPPAAATHLANGRPAHDTMGERKNTGAQAGTSGQAGIQKVTQPSCDFTLLAACAWELRERWLPSKVEQARGWLKHHAWLLLPACVLQ